MTLCKGENVPHMQMGGRSYRMLTTKKYAMPYQKPIMPGQKLIMRKEGIKQK